jgi:acyl carrier protein
MGGGKRWTEADVRERVRSYVVENFLYMRPEFDLGNETSLMDGGVLDSMGVVELLEFLQDEFTIVIDDDDISEANLESLAAIGRLVLAKHAAQSPEAA